jgi:Rhodopirellula transposase DDE domain
MQSSIKPTLLSLSASQIEDLKLASSKMSGAERRAFPTMILKYCRGNARLAERIFGWGRDTVQLGLNEQRTGVICQGAQAACSGDKLWEEKHPEVAQALWALAELHSQQDPTFRTLLSYTRLTAAEALKQLRAQGFQEDQLPSPSTMANVLNRNGYRLCKVLKAKPLKKLPETDAIPSTKLRTGFANIKEKDKTTLEGENSVDGGQVKRLSIDCKATVNIGDYSRGGKTRGDARAADHDMGCEEKYTPFGIVPESSGVRTQFLKLDVQVFKFFAYGSFENHPTVRYCSEAVGSRQPKSLPFICLPEGIS